MSETRGSKLETVRQFIAHYMAAIADGLPTPYRLTIVARHPGFKDADIIVTDDSLDDAMEAIRKLKDRPEALVDPKKGSGDGV